MSLVAQKCLRFSAFDSFTRNIFPGSGAACTGTGANAAELRGPAGSLVPVFYSLGAGNNQSEADAAVSGSSGR